MAAIGSVMMSTTGSVNYIVKDSQSVTQLKGAVNRIGGELRGSAQGRIWIDGAATDYDVLKLQVLGGTAPAYGAEDAGGTFRDGWYIRYTVSSSNLVREVLSSSGSVVSSGTAALGVDRKVGSVKGFAVTKVGALYNVLLRLRAKTPDGKDFAKEMATSFFVPN